MEGSAIVSAYERKEAIKGSSLNYVIIMLPNVRKRDHKKLSGFRGNLSPAACQMGWVKS